MKKIKGLKVKSFKEISEHNDKFVNYDKKFVNYGSMCSLVYKKNSSKKDRKIIFEMILRSILDTFKICEEESIDNIEFFQSTDDNELSVGYVIRMNALTPKTK